MSEHDRARCVLPRAAVAIAALLATLASTGVAQSDPAPHDELPRIRGRVVRESDGSPVVGALVEAYPAFRVREETRTDERGEFARVGAAEWRHTTATNEKPYDLVQYLTVSGPGIARTLVDPCAEAPWASPIRTRSTAVVRGRIERAPIAQVNHVVVIAPWKDLCWPPRTGLTRVDLRWLCDLDADGRFEIRDVPAEVPLELHWNAGTSGSRGAALVDEFVLAPGEVRELALAAPDPLAPSATDSTDRNGAWTPVLPIAEESAGASPYLVAFEIVAGGRFARHKVGGGRWHMHGSRACNDLEALPGPRTIVAFDARGHFGCTTIDLPADGLTQRPRVPLGPGALLRIAFDGPEERARIALVAKGIEFAARELPRGVVAYELAPAGAVQLRVTSTTAEPRTVEVDARAGELQRVDV